VRGLLDTSILVGLEADRFLEDLPDEAAISVISLEELTLGVLMAEVRGDHDLAQHRQETLDAVGAMFDALPVSRAVAVRCAEFRARGRSGGVRIGPFDALIAATASVASIPLFTQDVAIAKLPGLDVRLV